MTPFPASNNITIFLYSYFIAFKKAIARNKSFFIEFQQVVYTLELSPTQSFDFQTPQQLI